MGSPFGKLAPGMVDIDIVFKNMWREAEKNREKWGCKFNIFVYRLKMSF